MSKKDKMKVVILILLWAVVFYPLYPELINEWTGNSDNSHAFIVPLIAMYFVWHIIRSFVTVADVPWDSAERYLKRLEISARSYHICMTQIFV